MIHCPLFEAYLKTPNALLFNNGSEKYTYEEFHLFVGGIEEELKDLPKNPIYIISHPLIQTYVLIIALLRLNKSFILLHPKNINFFEFKIIDPSTFSLKKLNSKNILIDHHKPLLFFMSSGTTGNPKLIAHSLNTILQSAKSSVEYYKMDETSSYFNPLPINHVGGLMVFFRILVCGGSVVLKNNEHFNFCSLVPTQLYRIIKSNDQVLESLKRCKKVLVGGSKTSNKLITESEKLKIPLSITYGLTEMASQVISGDKGLIDILPNKDIKIENNGDLLVKGSSLFLGYNFLISPPKLINGYFPTNDLAKKNSDGTIEILGRKDRVIIKGGENIHPEILENFIIQNFDVFQIFILGLEDEEYGEKIFSFIDPYDPGLFKIINKELKKNFGSFYTISHFRPIPQYTGIKPSLSILKKELMSLKPLLSPLEEA